ncbi:hypothetical protein HGRIS_006511 [Hohenbuehelia grisea]|uniref:Uncharacterized protein n=1 Tax=Hohenbuehelia grisea TaxID=104357 RepID=A0ABR3J9K0_9AGAR
MSFGVTAPPSSTPPPLPPNAFSLFTQPQNPREAHAQIEDFRQVLRPSNRSASSGSVKRNSASSASLKKFLGGL